MWDHELIYVVSNQRMVTEDYIEKKLKNKRFVKHAFDNDRLMMNTTASSNEKSRETRPTFSITYTRVILPTR